jgi:hypothetical protein
MLLTSINLAAGMVTMDTLVRKGAAEVQIRIVEFSAKRKPIFQPATTDSRKGFACHKKVSKKLRVNSRSRSAPAG